MKKLLFSIILICGVSLSILIPCYFHYAEPYFAPSVINGINILKYGHINYDTAQVASQRLKSDLDIELSYPAPGILSSMLLAITNLPYDKLAYIPIGGLAVLFYFMLARYVLNGKNRNYAIIMAIAFYWLSLSNHIPALTTGRACLGSSMLILFIFSYLHLLLSKPSNYSCWLMICIIITIMSSITYYTSTFAIIIIVAICSIFVRTKYQTFSPDGIFSIPRGFSLFVIAIFAFFLPPALSSITPHLSAQIFFQNIIDTFLMKLGQEGTEVGNMYGIVLQENFINLLRLWSTRIILAFSIITPIYIFVTGLNKDRRNVCQWFYAIIATCTSISELPYVFNALTLSTRYLMNFCSLCIFCTILLLDKIRKPLSIILIMLVTVVIFSNLVFGLKQGRDEAAKPFAVEKIQPMANYISKYVPSGSIAADASYTTNLWLYLEQNDKMPEIGVSPISEDAILLKQAQDGSVTQFVNAMDTWKIQYIVLNFDGMPFYGDVWGYATVLHSGKWLDMLPYNQIYNNGEFIFFKIF